MANEEFYMDPEQSGAEALVSPFPEEFFFDEEPNPENSGGGVFPEIVKPYLVTHPDLLVTASRSNGAINAALTRAEKRWGQQAQG